jgi:hypothetical protein
MPSHERVHGGCGAAPACGGAKWEDLRHKHGRQLAPRLGSDMVTVCTRPMDTLAAGTNPLPCSVSFRPHRRPNHQEVCRVQIHSVVSTMVPPAGAWALEVSSETKGTCQEILDHIKKDVEQCGRNFWIQQTQAIEKTGPTQDVLQLVVSLGPSDASRVAGTLTELVRKMIDTGHILRVDRTKDATLLENAKQTVLKAFGSDLVLSAEDYTSSPDTAEFFFLDAQRTRYSVKVDRATGAMGIERGARPRPTPARQLPPLEIKLTKGQVKRLASEIQESRRLMVLKDGGALLVAGTIKHHEKRTVGTGAVLQVRAVRREIFEAVRDLMSKA